MAAVARAYGLDRKTLRTWERRGQFARRTPRPVVSCLGPYKDWRACRAPEVDYNATVLFLELKVRGTPGSEIIARRAVVPSVDTQIRPPVDT